MANTQVSKPASAPQRRVPDVFDALHGELDRVFRTFERGWPRWPSLLHGAAMDIALPNIDVHENSNAITIEADLPGLDEKDVSVTLANGVLTIKGERKSAREEKDESYYLSERSFGSFERSLKLPDTVDESNIEARFDKGVLKVIAAKKPGADKAEKKIQIKKG
ncbi:Hsp20/alpha crystallin family protein [Hyphomicrobium sp. CS1GBMeth3]|uniref:Hsp20/alpha crystallin family protein n=1 Tax=Hyphomicrobium sp. CS1GBMeth3 TaxID=1892845 RepID=UPI0009313E3D|nr:Hsp20/alpha crystallin family protein [Hyphomicrobium sp. CS1GBMeth3]